MFITRHENDRGYVTKLTETADGQGTYVEWTTSLGRNILPWALATDTDAGSGAASVYVAYRDQSEDLWGLSKFDDTGSLSWTQLLSAGTASDGGDLTGLDVESGVVYLAGRFVEQVDLDADGPSLPITSWGPEDGFVARYDNADGQVLSCQRIGGTGSDKVA